MERVYFKSEIVKDEILNFIKDGTIIPIIGSGFTKGEKLEKGTVPSGEEFRKQMIKVINDFNKDITYDELINDSFSEVSETFWEIVNEKRRKEILKSNFIGVKLSSLKKKFLQIDWPYIYTINIDDAIERNSEYKPVLPYKRINKEQVYEMKRVYKMHGDALEEIAYNDEKESIIFNKDHYINSLEENKEMLNEFISDYKENNIIYIGCSLDDEIDLHYAVNKVGDLSGIRTNRYFVTNETITAKKEIKLRKYGINKILIVDDYNKFYKELVDISVNNVVFGTEQINYFKNPKIDFLEEDKDSNLSSLLTVQEIYKDNKFKMPSYFIERECTKDIINGVQNNDLVALVGRRISGKTFIIADIIKKIRNKDIYFFPSTVIVSEEIINKLLEIKDSILIFDSNSLEFSNLLLIKRKIQMFIENKTKIIIVANTNDNIMFTFNIEKEKYKIKEIKVENIFNKNEYKRVNNCLSKLGIAEFRYNRNKNRGITKLTILDNIVRLGNEVYKDIPNKMIVDSINITNDIDEKHLKILILLAIADKIYRPILQKVGIDDECLTDIKRRYNPIVDTEISTKIEKRYHTREKVICNSKVWLLYMLGHYSSFPAASEVIGKVIGEIVECLVNYKEYKQIIKNIILFDNLNQIFVKEQRGAIKVIFEVYSCLQKTLYNDSNYWLQRAKSILNLKRTEEKELKNALDYALKAFNDADKDNRLKIKENSSLTIAMIYGRLFSISKCKNKNYLRESINWYYTAIVKFSGNKYIDDFIQKSQVHKKSRQRSDLEVVLEHISEVKLNTEIFNKCKQLYIVMSQVSEMIAATK